MAALCSFLFLQPPWRESFSLHNIHLPPVVFRAPGWSLQFGFLPRNPPPDQFHLLLRKFPFQSTLLQRYNSRMVFCTWRRPMCLCLQNRWGNSCWKSPPKQRLRLPHLSPRTQRGFPLPSWCWFVLPMWSLHLCLPHVPWRSSTCTSGCVLVENKSTCSVIQPGHASPRCLCCTGRAHTPSTTAASRLSTTNVQQPHCCAAFDLMQIYTFWDGFVKIPQNKQSYSVMQTVHSKHFSGFPCLFRGRLKQNSFTKKN